jgi:hypothetical protein
MDALRLVLRTQPRSANVCGKGWAHVERERPEKGTDKVCPSFREIERSKGTDPQQRPGGSGLNKIPPYGPSEGEIWLCEGMIICLSLIFERWEAKFGGGNSLAPIPLPDIPLPPDSSPLRSWPEVLLPSKLPTFAALAAFEVKFTCNA